MRRAWLTAAWLLSNHCSSWMATARADCLAPPFELLWSYPAQGDSDVPLDATFWLLTNQGDLMPPVSATLNGVYVPALATKSDLRLGQAAFRPPQLQPNTSYALRVTYTSGADAGKSFVIRFSSGREKGGRAQTAVRARVHGGVDGEEHPCVGLLRVQDCFDDPGQTIALYTFAVTASNTIAWYVKEEGADQTYFWPAACGNPTIQMRAADDSRCYYLYGIDVRGELASLTRHCGAAQSMPRRGATGVVPHYAGPVKEEPAAEPPQTGSGTQPEAANPSAPAAVAHTDQGEPERSGGCGSCRAAGTRPGSSWWVALVGLAAWRGRARARRSAR